MRFTGFFEAFAGWANDSREGSAMAIPPARRKFLRVNEVFMDFESTVQEAYEGRGSSDEEIFL